MSRSPGTGDPVVAKLGRGRGDIESFGADPRAARRADQREDERQRRGRRGAAGRCAADPRGGSRGADAARLPSRRRRDRAAVEERRVGGHHCRAAVDARTGPGAGRGLAARRLLVQGDQLDRSPRRSTSITLVVDQATDAIPRRCASASSPRRRPARWPATSRTRRRRPRPRVAGQAGDALARKSGLEIRVRDDRELRAEGLRRRRRGRHGFGEPAAPDRADLPPDRRRSRSTGTSCSSARASRSTRADSRLKPNAGMIAMKTDMAAGGAIIAAMSVMRELGVRVQVTGLVPAAENMPSGSAQRPSDVITQYGGMTVEVLNTDAEGRLVLADALAYADAELDPDVHRRPRDLDRRDRERRSASGTPGSSPKTTSWPRSSTAAGADSGEAVWRMPFVDDYAAGSRLVGRRPRRTWRSTAARSSAAARSSPPCSCANSSDAGGGRISTSPASVGPRRTNTRSRRVPTGFRRPPVVALARRCRPAARPALSVQTSSCRRWTLFSVHVLAVALTPRA